jgi:hypothetical protein
MRSLPVRFTLFVSLILQAAAFGQVPGRINYQGRLLDGTNLVNGTVGLSLRLFDAPALGTLLYEDSNAVTVADGFYATFLGDDSTFGNLDAALAATNLHIEVMVNGAALAPRERVASVAYALVAGGVEPGGIVAGMIATGAVTGADLANSSVTSLKIADGSIVNGDINVAAGIAASKIAATSFWEVAGNAGTVPGTHFLGTTDNQPLEIRVNNARVWRLAESGGVPSLTGGHASNSITGAAVGSVIAGGGGTGVPQRVLGAYAFIGGGANNRVGDRWSVVGGGYGNSIETIDIVGQRDYGTIGGGFSNAIGSGAFLGHMGTIAGGGQNAVRDDFGVIGGGTSNLVAGTAAVIGGGVVNTASASYAAIGGGSDNHIQNGAGYSVIAGGVDNVIGTNAINASLGGGSDNRITGGSGNTIAGGLGNRVKGTTGSIGGGQDNEAGTNALGAAIGGGFQNSASNWYATVPGGFQNVAAGSISLAAGNRARALHGGAFVWSDSRTNGAASVTNDEFAISASNGLRVTDNLDTNELDRIGRRFRDNAIYAWATVSGAGVVRESFGVASVTNIGQGIYSIVFHAAAVDGLNICPVVTPELDAAPANAAALRLASVNALPGSNRYVQVFINNGSGAPTNNDFNIIVTGR